MNRIYEKDIEKLSIISYFTNNLGYKEISKDQISKELFVKEDLLKFISENNQYDFNNILKNEFKNDLDKFYIEFKNTLLEEIQKHKNHNNAFILKNGLYFYGKKFKLFNFTNNLQKENCNFDKNIFSLSSQFNVNLVNLNGERILNSNTFIPDLIFFINGIYFSYMEIKFNSTNQNAKIDGCEQILNKYLDSTLTYERYIKNNNIANREADLEKYRVLNIFHSAIYVTSFDSHSLYQIRNFNIIENYLKNINLEEINKKYYKKINLKHFKKYPTLNNENNLNFLLLANYSKETLEREILYFNYSERVKKETSNSNNRSYLISPRPNQKFGVEKTYNCVLEYLKYENNEEYWDNKFKKAMNLDLYSLEIQNKILEQHKNFLNNKYINSILLSYSTGFGKTKIIGWLSLLLKDIVKDNKYAYNTIFLITDRLELKSQTYNSLEQMNISKSMIHEVKNTKDFVNCLKINNKRIVLVNIQKFQSILDKLSKNDIEILKSNRNAFIIDEIHRSNSGTQHEDMMSIFSDKVDTNTQMKNLLIGLTATPKEETINRFGEYINYINNHIIYKPHDEFTMLESIEAGYTLDFRDKITPIAISMSHQIIGNKFDENGNLIPQKFDKNEIYENEERIDNISKKIVEHLLNSVYKQIRGKGKAMLACQSIDCAIQHFYKIKKYLEEEVQKPEYEKYKDSKVFIVFTQNKDSFGSFYYNNKSEKEVLKDFKELNNGIIIVVEKLLTGFDEPLLHTLFVNKEIQDISAIQALSRVNRIAKDKLDCHIIDFSHENINSKKYFPKAISKYFKSQISEFNFAEPFNVLEKSYKFLNLNILKSKFFKKFKEFNNEENINEYIKLEEEIKNFLKMKDDNFIKNLINYVYKYFENINLLNYIINNIDKYKDEDLIIFYKTILNLINQSKLNENYNEVKFEFDNIGEISNNIIIKKSLNKENNNENSKDFKNIDWDSILKKQYELDEDSILKFKNFCKNLFNCLLIVSKNEYNVDFISIIEDEYKDENILFDSFEKMLNRLIRKRNRYEEFKLENTEENFKIIDSDKDYYLFKFKQYIKNLN